MVLRMLLLLLVCAWAPASAFVRVNPATQMFEDASGRTVVFHGVNAVYKQAPWLPSTGAWDAAGSLNEQDAAQLAAWGFNAVRLGVMWPGVAPALGAVDAAYLARVRGVVRTLAGHGIATLIDLHQDLYSRMFCGEGAPDWLVRRGAWLPFPVPALGGESYAVDNNTLYPALEQCLSHVFSDYYWSQAVGQAFQRLYDNDGGDQDALVAYWTAVAAAFANESAVVGYELINEPWAGDVYTDPILIVPGMADKMYLAPMYTRLHQAIRAVDDRHVLFFEKCVANPLEYGAAAGPGGPEYNDRQAYSYHVYCGLYSRNGSVQNVMECDGIDEALWIADQNDVRRLGAGGFMTEFGANPESGADDVQLRYLLEKADNSMQSWAYWQYKYFADLTTTGSGESFYDAAGKLQGAKVRTLSRCYPQAVAGVPTSYSFDPDYSSCVVSFTPNYTISAPTVIYLNAAWYYPLGIAVTVSPTGAASWSQPDANHLELTLLAPHVSAITVTIDSN